MEPVYPADSWMKHRAIIFPPLLQIITYLPFFMPVRSKMCIDRVFTGLGTNPKHLEYISCVFLEAEEASAVCFSWSAHNS